MIEQKCLIVNADDFGQTRGINRGIIEAYEQGIVTSASLMVRCEAAAEAASYAREHPSLSTGIHIEVGEWKCEHGTWTPVYEVVPTNERNAIVAEVSRQLTLFREMLGRTPTHIDSHQDQHLREPLRSVLVAESHKLEVPLRKVSADIRYCGEFYGQSPEGLPRPGAITVSNIIQLLSHLPSGVTELSCHPGFGSDLVKTMYRDERELELAVLCDPRVRAALEANGIELCSFRSDNVRQAFAPSQPNSKEYGA